MHGIVSKVLVLLCLFFLAANVFAVAPQISVPDKEIHPQDWANGFVNDVIDIWGNSSDLEDADSALSFAIVSQSNRGLIDCFVDGQRFVDCYLSDDESLGVSIVEIEVTDSSGLKGRDSFAMIVSDRQSGALSCSDIDISARTIYIPEDSTDSFSFLVNNLSDRDFEITDVRIVEASSFAEVNDVEVNDYFIGEGADTRLNFSVDAFNVSGTREATAVVQIKGEFDNGKTCSFTSTQQSFRIVVEEGNQDDGGGSLSICSDIEIVGKDIVLDEDDLETVDVKVRNDNTRDFRVDFVTVSESSSDFSVAVSSRPSVIDGGSEETIRLRFDTDRVSSDQSGRVTLRISGSFSSGKTCSGSQISEQLDVEVQNSGSSSNDDIEIIYGTQAVRLNPGQSTVVGLSIENNSSSRKCVALDFSFSEQNFSAVLGQDDFCISAHSEKETDLTIRANSNAIAGNYSGRLVVEFGTRTKSANIAMAVLGTPPVENAGSLEVINFPSSVSLVGGDVEFFNLTLSNNSSAAVTNLAVTIEGMPQGVFFQPYFRQRLEKGEIITVNQRIETLNAQSGEFDAVLKISHDGGTISRPVKLTVTGQSAGNGDGQGSPSGLASLAGTVGVGLVLLGILVVVIVVVVLLVRR